MSPTRYDDVLSWASEIEDNTLEQAKVSSRLPFVQRPIALMPDAHLGHGATIGSVIATKGAVIPSAVGVDIGCGVVAMQLDLTAADLPDDLTKIHHGLQRGIPSGMGKGHENRISEQSTAATTHLRAAAVGMVDFTPRQEQVIAKQMGTLGGGNHFVEICLDEFDKVWIVLHSGSRGIGNQLAKIHIEGAKKLMKRYFIELEDPELAFLVQGTPEFDAYIAAMLWAQDYAMANRRIMVEAAHRELEHHLARTIGITDLINTHHNFCQMEHHYNQDMWVTRKGAIQARVGDRGIIPGSMGTKTYIVEGLGNPSSYNSCSHGAGRRMSRTQARKSFDVEGLTELMAGKTWNERQAKDLLDEDPRSYKDIDVVMNDQKDLVTITHTLHQVLNYKGV